MPKYLTQDWLDECRRLGADQPERLGASAGIQYVIEGGEEVKFYAVVFENGRIVHSALGKLADPDVVLTLSYEDSVSIQKGDLDANVAFNEGRIQFDGEMRKLMSLLPILWPSPTRRLGSAGRYRALQEQIRAMTEY